MSFQLLSWLNYYLKAKPLSGHGIHSPFVFDLARNVLAHTHSTAGGEVQQFYRALQQSKELISFSDMGAGAQQAQELKRMELGQMVRLASRKRKEGELFLRLAQQFKPNVILEMGTHMSFSALYFLAGNANTHLITLEGSPEIAAQAKKHFALFNRNPELWIGEFDITLKTLLSKPDFMADLILLDGNHREQATLDYLKRLKPFLSEDGFFIVDDIRWSKGMLNAWNRLVKDEEIALSIDLGKLGLLFPNRKQEKEHFLIRF